MRPKTGGILGATCLLTVSVLAACSSDFAYDQWKKNVGNVDGGSSGRSGRGGSSGKSHSGEAGAAGETSGQGGRDDTGGQAGAESGGEAGSETRPDSAGADAGGQSGEGGDGGKSGTAGSAGMGEPKPLAATPPMGWNSWNRFGSGVSEGVVRAIADVMVSSGMRDAGYEYLNIDDTWQARARDGYGVLTADPARFPNGIKALADYAHERGLKLGLYSDRGTQTCAGLPGSYGHEELDAATFAEWGVDYLKYDNCYIPSGREGDAAMEEDYRAMRDALDATGRPIMFSICAWWFQPWMPEVGHLWRTTTDITDGWTSNMLTLVNRNGGHRGRYSDASYAEPGIAHYAGPGGWNDPDMLEVGNGGMSAIEYRSHFSLWAMMASPLIAGNDLRAMSAATKEILLNTEVIAVDQDPLGQQGVPISASTQLEVWKKELAGDKTYAVLLFNRSDAAADIRVDWDDLGFDAATARDLWAHEDLGRIEDAYTANVPRHGVVMLRVVGE